MSYSNSPDCIAEDNLPPPKKYQAPDQTTREHAGPLASMSLPIAAASHPSILVLSHCSCGYWEYNDGSKLTVSMDPLREGN